jgi:hypothetical protein
VCANALTDAHRPDANIHLVERDEEQSASHVLHPTPARVDRAPQPARVSANVEATFR